MTLQDHMIRTERWVTLWLGAPIGKYHPAKFGGHMHCGSADVMALVCHAMLQNHVIKGSCDFMGRNL